MCKLMPVMLHYSEKNKKQQYVSFDELNNEHALSNHSQSLIRLSERGGMSPCEIWANINNRSPRDYFNRSEEVMLEKLSDYLTY